MSLEGKCQVHNSDWFEVRKENNERIAERTEMFL